MFNLSVNIWHLVPHSPRARPSLTGDLTVSDLTDIYIHVQGQVCSSMANSKFWYSDFFIWLLLLIKKKIIPKKETWHILCLKINNYSLNEGHPLSYNCLVRAQNKHKIKKKKKQIKSEVPINRQMLRKPKQQQ